jgi:hypothetical protein
MAARYSLILKQAKRMKVPYPIFANMMGMSKVVRPEPTDLGILVSTLCRPFLYVIAWLTIQILQRRTLEPEPLVAKFLLHTKSRAQ